MTQRTKRNRTFCSIADECDGCPRLGWCSDGTTLYLCDGKDPRCDERDKAICCRLVTGRPGCRHTPDPRHAISRIDPDFPKTECRPLGQEPSEPRNDRYDIWIEAICDNDSADRCRDAYSPYYDWDAPCHGWDDEMPS